LRNLLLGGASALAIAVLVGPVFAQDEGQIETVVVTGFRASLESAQAIKQSSDQVVDSVTAVDIGALPDKSVAEALQRVPGIQLMRADQPRDPVRYGGNGNGVFIRGLSWVQALVNGRDAFSAVNGQALSFSDISANLMAGVDVYKNPNAKMIEGGVGGTVDLRTRKPFDQDGRLIAFSADYTESVLMGQGKPSANALFSDRWNTNIGEIGALLSIDYQDQENRTNGMSMYSIDQLTSATPIPCGSSTCTTLYIPFDDGANGQSWRQEKWEQKRVAVDLSLQWRPTDKLEFTLTGLYSKADPHEDEYDGEWSIQNEYNIPPLVIPPASQATYDANGVMTKDVVPNVWSLGQNTLVNDEHHLNADYSLNMKYTPTDDWTFTADFQLGESQATDRSMTVYADIKNNQYFNYFTWGGCTAAQAAAENAAIPGGNAQCLTWGGGKNYYWANSAPVFDMTLDENPSHPTMSFTNTAAMAVKSNYFWSSAMDHVEDNFAHDYAYRADGSHTFGGDGVFGWLKQAEFGVRGEYKQAVTRQSGWNWNVLSFKWWMNSWSGGPTSNVLSYVRTLDTTLPNDTALYHFGKVLGSTMPDLWLPTASFVGNPFSDRILSDPNVSTQGSYQSLAIKAGCPANVVEWKCMAIYGTVTPESDNVSGGINDQKEETLAGYLMLDFAHKNFLGTNVPVDGNVGVRVVSSKDTIAAGWLILPTITTPCVSPPLPAPQVDCTNYHAAQTFAGAGGRIPLGPVSHDYTDVLPSFDARAHLTDQLQARVAYSQAIVRPDISYTQNYTSLGFSFGGGTSAGTFLPAPKGLTGTGGNPNLKPMYAQQYDASLEWYFAPTGSLTFTMFHKDLSGYFYSDTRPETITYNGVTETFDITRTYNGNRGKISGFRALGAD
jgi:TonB-dependent receptor